MTAATIANVIATCTWVLIAVAGIPPSAAADRAAPQRQKQPEAYQERFVEWILEDPDGFFHPSIIWKRLGPDGKSGPYAMHAAEDIPSGTPLIVLPRKYVLESGVLTENDAYQLDDPRMCITVAKMFDEHFGKNETDNNDGSSFYAPYLSYLFEETTGGTTRGLLPTSWSAHSKEILSLILGGYMTEYDTLGHYISPYNFEYDSIFDICNPDVMEYNSEEDAENDNKNSLGHEEGEDKNKNENDNDNEKEKDEKEDEDGYEYEDEDEDEDKDEKGKEFWGTIETEEMESKYQALEDAYLFLISRGWYDKLLPVVDMFNHRNGRWRNVEITTINDEDGKDVAAYAWRDISKGDQLQYTYSECMDDTCSFGGVKYTFSTQKIFSEYGFTELYPQRWVIICDDDEEHEQTLHAEVTVDSHDESKLEFRWIFETPNEASVKFIEEQLARLKSVESEVQKGVDELESVLLGEDRSGTTIHNIEHERESILEFYHAYITMFELALEHKDNAVAVTLESFANEVIRQQTLGKQKTVEEIRKHELLATTTSSPTARHTAAAPSHSQEF
eukprot:CAMPEP_0197177016 /NCGR_PEP_ID=MMETSP1423-20130617/2768_1 /TAXON_ID=476441 /ORGANISM="Pseudo-nitzschia heimii, Strain UNC1101" /LENGTH=559 /DNA_ID=CAMNT_0042626491 /DNA_START=51 /DNA_END=1730 /DNA_ORIENTATION=+